MHPPHPLDASSSPLGCILLTPWMHPPATHQRCHSRTAGWEDGCAPAPAPVGAPAPLNQPTLTGVWSSPGCCMSHLPPPPEWGQRVRSQCHIVLVLADLGLTCLAANPFACCFPAALPTTPAGKGAAPASPRRCPPHASCGPCLAAACCLTTCGLLPASCRLHQHQCVQLPRRFRARYHSRALQVPCQRVQGRQHVL